MMTYYKTNLKYLRNLLGVTQADIGLQTKNRSTTVSNWENGISKPDAEDIAAICQYFGISADSFLFLDLEKGNLITQSQVSNFKLNGSLFGNPIGNLKSAKPLVYQANDALPQTVREPENDLVWSVLSVLRQIDEKIDVVRTGVDSLTKKAAV